MDKGPEYSLGLVGWPLESTLSPLIHGMFLESSELRGHYSAYPLKPNEFLFGLRKIVDSGVTGLNVTYPHKTRAAANCDRLVEEASVLEAVNTLLVEDERISGYNTDVFGFRMFAEKNRLPEPFFLAGCGGAAAAASRALSLLEAEHRVFCRHPGKWNGDCECHDISDMPGLLERSSSGTLVNATPLGWSNEDGFPLIPVLFPVWSLQI